MTNKIKNVSSEVWTDLVKSCKLFTSACGFAMAGICLVNSVKEKTLCPIGFMDKPKAAEKVH